MTSIAPPGPGPHPSEPEPLLFGLDLALTFVDIFLSSQFDVAVEQQQSNETILPECYLNQIMNASMTPLIFGASEAQVQVEFSGGVASNSTLGQQIDLLFNNLAAMVTGAFCRTTVLPGVLTALVGASISENFNIKAADAIADAQSCAATIEKREEKTVFFVTATSFTCTAA